MSFSAYTEDVVDLLDRHKVQSHLYSDDTSQLYASCRPDDVDILRTRLSHYSANVAQRCACNMRQLYHENKARVIRIRVHVETMLLSNGDDIGGVKDEKQRPEKSLWNATECRH